MSLFLNRSIRRGKDPAFRAGAGAPDLSKVCQNGLKNAFGFQIVL
jgi:hypothetical protein